jgi:hypothetical protein
MVLVVQVHTCNPSMQEDHEFRGQTGLHSKTLSQNKKRTRWAIFTKLLCDLYKQQGSGFINASPA